MATKQFYHNIDLVNVGQLLGARLQNVTAAEQTTLAGQLGADNKGLTVYNSEEKRLYIWDGVQFVQQAVEVAGDLIFKGVKNASQSLDGQNVEKIAGYQYVVGTAGTLSLTGVTFTPSAVAEQGDVFFFTSPTEAYVLQRNDEEATEDKLGNVRLATQAEVDAGVQATEAVTPATLHGYLDPIFANQAAIDAEQFGRIAATEEKNLEQDGRLTSLEADRVKHFFTSVDLTVGANTITHNLNLADRDGFVINTHRNNSQISLDVDSVSANAITLTTLVPLTGVKVTIIGRAAA